MARNATFHQSSSQSASAYSGTWMLAHFLVFLALMDAFLFRSLLVPELLETEAAITEQVTELLLWALAVVAPLILIYAVTRRTALARALLYHLGAWMFFGVTVYAIIGDYQQYGEPGSFTARINNTAGRVEGFVGFALPRLE